MGKGYSICIGLNSVDAAHYGGWNGQLNAPEKDASDIKMLTSGLGYSTDILLGKNATGRNVRALLSDAAASLKKGDILLVYYSGHGGKLPDLDGDEEDGVDETWCLYDGELMDDEIRHHWAKFNEDVRVFVLSDSCHSGTVIKMLDENETTDPLDCMPRSGIKSMPNQVAQKTFIQNQEYYRSYIKGVDRSKKGNGSIKASVRLISGCQDNQSSYDGAFNSKFTEKLLTVWNDGKFRGNYEKFHSQIQKLLPPYQSPNHLLLGKSHVVFNEQIPFTI